MVVELSLVVGCPKEMRWIGVSTLARLGVALLVLVRCGYGRDCRVKVQAFDFEGRPERVEVVQVETTGDLRAGRLRVEPRQSLTAPIVVVQEGAKSPWPMRVRYRRADGGRYAEFVAAKYCGEYVSLVVEEKVRDLHDGLMTVTGTIVNCGCYPGMWIHMMPLFGGKLRGGGWVDGEVEAKSCRFSLSVSPYAVAHTFVVGAGAKSLAVFDRVVGADRTDFGEIVVFDRECRVGGR